MRIAVFGAGGVGGYFGGRLAQARQEVVFIARGAHLQAMRLNGLRVDSILGNFHVQPVVATDDPEVAGAVDVVLIAVKTWQAVQITQKLFPLLKPSTGIVWLGNGIEVPDLLMGALGREHVFGGLTRISAAIAGPGHIRHSGIEPFIAFNELDGCPTNRVAGLKNAFEQAQGVAVSIPSDIQAAIWEKFIFIAAFSGVGAIARAPVGLLRSIPETRLLLRAAIAEATAVARARGIHLPKDQADRTLAFIDAMAPDVTSSMQRDIQEGRPSELDAQSGAVVRIGRELGIPTPAHEFILAGLLPQEITARGKIEN